MTPEQFTYWLQGFFEMTETNKLSEKQVLMVKEHLKLVFNKVTPTSEELDKTQKVYIKDGDSKAAEGLFPPNLSKEAIDKALDRAGRLPRSWSCTNRKLC